jgi:hypothetical protein
VQLLICVTFFQDRLHLYVSCGHEGAVKRSVTCMIKHCPGSQSCLARCAIVSLFGASAASRCGLAATYCLVRCVCTRTCGVILHGAKRLTCACITCSREYDSQGSVCLRKPAPQSHWYLLCKSPAHEASNHGHPATAATAMCVTCAAQINYSATVAAAAGPSTVPDLDATIAK